MTVLAIFTMGLGSILSGGCVAAPAVLLTSTAVTVAAVVTEGERQVQYPDAESPVIVRSDEQVASPSAKTCRQHPPRLEFEAEQPDA